jgi:hypothetical protein
VKRSSKGSADNYCAEILGGVGAKLLVNAAVTERHKAAAHIPGYGCDNLGIVIHDNNCRCPMLEKLAQVDVLRLFKLLISSSQIGGSMYHVRGHMDKLLRQDESRPTDNRK